MAARKHDTEADLERIAEILVEGFRDGNWEATAKRRGVSSRTLRNWKQRLDSDPMLADVFRSKMSGASRGWLEEAPKALNACVAFITKAATDGDHQNPEMLHSVAGAFKLLAEVSSTWEILQLKLARMKAADAGRAGETREVRATPGAPARSDGAAAEELAVH